MAIVHVPAVAHGPGQYPVNRVVMHATVSGTVAGGAVANAHFLNTVGLSAHYLCDPATVCQMLSEEVIGYHDGHNVNEVGIELCDWQSGSPTRWQDEPHQAMLRLAATLVRGICARHAIPMERIQAPLGTKRGICGHVDVTNTWHESTHQDPDVAGPFPWTQFIGLVNGTSAPVEDEVTPDDIQAVAAAVWSAQMGRTGVNFGVAISRIYGASTTDDTAALVAAIKAALPQNTGPGGLSVADVEAAVKHVLTAGTASP